ncbi:MAG: glycosyltransferase family 9 protein [Chloroflexi bacterium]|nr:glycosyltransferase family 9 protein [Chloroflexota bacterium]
MHLCINPLLTLGQLKSLVARCDLLICNDAGPRHFAKAFNVPVVTVFGPTHPQWTSTSYERERIVRIDVDCGPCQQPICPLGHLDCINGVTVEAVFDACRELLTTRSASATGETTGESRGRNISAFGGVRAEPRRVP